MNSSANPSPTPPNEARPRGKPYTPPRITTQLPLEARAGTAIGGFYGYRDPKTGKKYDPQHPPISYPNGGR